MQEPILTLKQLKDMSDRVFKDYDQNKHIIKWWKTPFLWILWLFIGETIELENWKFYKVYFKGTLYMLESKEIHA